MTRFSGCRVVGLSILVLFSAALFGQTPAPAAARYTPSRPLAIGDFLLTLPTSHIPRPRTWEVRFTHRFNQSIDSGEAIHSLFGLDSNADVGLGASYVVHPRVQLSFYRSNAMDDVELAAKYVALQQAPAIPLSAAFRVGGDWRTERDLRDRTSLFAQAILSRAFGDRWEVFALPTYVTSAGRQGTGDGALFKHAFNVPVGAAYMLGSNLSVAAELYPVNTDLPGTIDAQLGWSLGVKLPVGGHHFEILVTNNNATHADQYVTSTYMGSPLRRGDFHLGFNIERRFGR